MVGGGTGLAALHGLGPLSPCHTQLVTAYSNRIPGCPVDIPNPSIIPQPASAAQQVPHVRTLTSQPWEHQETGERGAEPLPKPLPCIRPPQPWRVRAGWMLEQLCHPSGSSTTQNLGVLFCPMRRAGESCTHSSFIMTPPEPRTGPPPQSRCSVNIC